MHPHIPRPRRKATRTDTAGVVRTVHGAFMWPFAARVNEKTAAIAWPSRPIWLERNMGISQTVCSFAMQISDHATRPPVAGFFFGVAQMSEREGRKFFFLLQAVLAALFL